MGIGGGNRHQQNTSAGVSEDMSLRARTGRKPAGRATAGSGCTHVARTSIRVDDVTRSLQRARNVNQHFCCRMTGTHTVTTPDRRLSTAGCVFGHRSGDEGHRVGTEFSQGMATVVASSLNGRSQWREGVSE